MTESRQKLRPWLEGILNKGDVAGVAWLDENKTMFRLPWSRLKRGDNGESGDGKHEIYKRWALHTGKFREGIDKEDHVKWKSRLRCALNKAKDIESVEEESRPNDPDPFKVYQFIAQRGENNLERTSGVTNSRQCLVEISDVLTVEENVERLPSDLMSVETNNLISLDLAEENCINNLSIGMDSVQLQSSDQQHDFATLSINFGGALEFSDKLDRSLLEKGLLIAYDGFSDWLACCEYSDFAFSKMPNSIFDTMTRYSLNEEIWNLEFFPGLVMKLSDDEVVACSFIQTPLKCRSGCREFFLNPYNEVSLSRNEGCLELVVASPSEVFIVSLTIEGWERETMQQSLPELGFADLISEGSLDNNICHAIQTSLS